MALAHLRYRGKSDGYHLFDADIGTAKFFRYVFGDEKRRLRVGKREVIEVLSGEKGTSKLMQINEAMHKIGQGRFPLKVAESKLNNRTKYLQLYSYTQRGTTAPTVSNIIRLFGNNATIENYNKSKMSKMFTYETDDMTSTVADTPVKNKEFNYREPGMSKVMFWNAIVSALPTIVEKAAPIIGSLLKGGSQPSAGSPTPSGSTNQTTDVVNQILEVLKAISDNQKTTATPSASSENSTQQSLSYYSSSYSLKPDTILGLQPILERFLSSEAILAIGDDPQKLFMAIKDLVHKTEGTLKLNQIKTQEVEDTKKKNNYSEAKIAPALLAALPALMPVIEKVLNPETIKAIGDQPVKMFKAIGDAVLKMDEQEIKHLEAINPGVDSADDIAKLLQGMSIPNTHSKDLIRFKPIKNLKLEFLGTRTVSFQNKERVLYSKNARISIPHRIESTQGIQPQKILNKSIIQIILKDARTMKLVFRKNIKLLDLNIGKDINEAYLLPEEVSNIPSNTELKLEVSHIWKSSKNINIGVFKCHYIHLIDSFIYDRIGESIGDPQPLNDLNLHRKFWHKIWEGGFSKSLRWEVSFDIKYFYLLNLNENGISRLESRKKIVQDNTEQGHEHPKRRKVHAKLKSGLEFSLESLNLLLKLLSQDLLTEEQMSVIRSSTSLAKQFHQVARQRVELKGREGDTATLWSYPEIALRKLYLSKVGQTDELGQVVQLETVELIIPMPSSIHLIGTKSER